MGRPTIAHERPLNPRSAHLITSTRQPCKTYRIRQLAGTPGRVPVDRARRHVQALTGYGLSYAAIARAAGVTSHVILSAVGHTAVDKHLIDHRTEKAILGVTWRPHPRQAQCLAIGARRRAHALARIGWSLTWQAEQIGVTDVTNYSKQIGKARIHYDLWAAIRDLYERYSGTPGTYPKAAGHAARNGWPSPLAWDHIDDPDEKPAGMEITPVWRPAVDPIAVELLAAGKTVPHTLAERRAAVGLLTAAGHSADAIAKLLGIAERSVVRHRAQVAA